MRTNSAWTRACLMTALAWACLLSSGSPAPACPNCAAAVASSERAGVADPLASKGAGRPTADGRSAVNAASGRSVVSGRLGEGFSYSILFMLAVPVTLLAGLATALWVLGRALPVAT